MNETSFQHLPQGNQGTKSDRENVLNKISKVKYSHFSINYCDLQILKS